MSRPVIMDAIMVIGDLGWLASLWRAGLDVVVPVPFLGGSCTIYILGVFDVLVDFVSFGTLFIVISPI